MSEPLTRPQPHLTLAGARQMIDAALERAREMDKRVAIAVVDPSGVLIASVRMDGAPVTTVDVARQKAWTAAVSRKNTADWFQTLQEDEPLRLGAAASVPGLVTYGGGQMVVIDDDCVGAIGVSGSHWTGDTEIGRAALAAITG